jgi:hypothetical protein
MVFKQFRLVNNNFVKKLIIKNKHLRNSLKIFNKKYFLLKLIMHNYNIFSLFRIKTNKILYLLKNYAVSISDRCIVSFNKKKFNKFIFYSRLILLKKIYKGLIVGLKNSIW